MSKPESLCLALRQFEKRCDLGVAHRLEWGAPLALESDGTKGHPRHGGWLRFSRADRDSWDQNENCCGIPELIEILQRITNLVEA